MSASTTSGLLPTEGVYRIDPSRSTVKYSGRHMFGLGTVHADFTISSGEVRIAAVPTDSSVVVCIAAGSFSSNNAKRDKDVTSAGLLDVASHPEITFASSGLVDKGDHWLLDGDVTAHSHTVPVQLKVTEVSRLGDGIHVVARAQGLDRYLFGITKSKGMVGRYLDLDLDVTATPELAGV